MLFGAFLEFFRSWRHLKAATNWRHLTSMQLQWCEANCSLGGPCSWWCCTAFQVLLGQQWRRLRSNLSLQIRAKRVGSWWLMLVLDPLTRWPVSVWQSIYSEQKIILGYAWTLTLHNFATLAPPTIYCNIYEYTYSHAILLDLCSSVFLVGWHFACWESGGHIMEVLSWQFLILDET